MDIKDKDGKVIAKVAKSPREALWDNYVRDTKAFIESCENQLELARFNLKNAEMHLKELQR